MPSNNVHSLSASELLALANLMRHVIGGASPNAFGVPGSQVSDLVGWATDLTNATTSSENAEGVAKAARTLKRTCTSGLADAVGAVARTVYANPDLTADQIASLGLQTRSTARTKVVPKTPTGLTVQIDPSGGVSLAFKRAGNAPGVIFRIESQSGSGPWTIIGETTSTRASLGAYPAGEPVGFRIVATKGGETALPTPLVSIYQSAVAAPTLRLAA